MLDKNDLEQIKKITVEVSERVTKKVTLDAFSEFFEKILAPYLDKEHIEIMDKFQEIEKDIDDDRKRISQVEAITNP